MSTRELQSTSSTLASIPMARFVAYFLRLGTIGFGGPIALAGHIQKDLVEERRWVSKQDYLEGLAFSQLSPGPLAAQLAMYLGWLRAGTLGATTVGIAFILPSFLMVLALDSPGRKQCEQRVFVRSQLNSMILNFISGGGARA